MAAELNDVIQLLGMCRKVQGGENLADECARRRKREGLAARVPPLLLEKRVGHAVRMRCRFQPGYVRPSK
jgi:hypothetical protein